MDSVMHISELFCSIDGEGPHTGGLSVFVRLHGCNLRCSYCDSRYSCEGNEFQKMPEASVLARIAQYPVRHVTITGGEPLLYPRLVQFVAGLRSINREVCIETNGSIEIPSDLLRDGVSVCMDVKSPSSEAGASLCKKNLELLRPQDSAKLVVSEGDLPWARDFLLDILPSRFPVYLSPIFGKCPPATLVDLAKALSAVAPTDTLRVQIQLHKFIWPASTRGV